MPVKTYSKQRKRWIGFIAVVICYAFVFLLVGSCLTMVEAGYQGVVFNLFSGVHPQVLDEGLHVHWPWEWVTLYPVSTETVSFAKGQALSVLTADGKKVQMDVLMSYHLEAAKLPGLMVRFRQRDWAEMGTEYLRMRLAMAIQSVVLKHSAVDLYVAKRRTAAAEIETEVTRELKKEGIHVEGLALVDLRVDARTQQLMQTLVESNIRHQSILRETENKKQLASQRRLEAESRREAMLIQAKGEAEANRLVNQSLTPEFMRYQKLLRNK
ncbi:SPFH domain-containing protein [Laceyella putida]|uniref:SPFH domain-containing protein n=1 Tax=Laceyella putida TaxID=110101 RepID=A0ABW2RQ00_9BACL